MDTLLPHSPAMVLDHDRQREVCERYVDRIRTTRAAGRTLLTYQTLLLMFDLPPLARPVDPVVRRGLVARVDEQAAVQSVRDHLDGVVTEVSALWTGVDRELVEELAGRGRVVARLLAGAVSDWPRPGRRKVSEFVAALSGWGVDEALVRAWVAGQCEALAAGESTRNAAQRAVEHAETAQQFVGVVEAHSERFGGVQALLSSLGVLAEQHDCGGPVGTWLTDTP